MQTLNMKKSVGFTIVKKTLEKNQYLVVESTIKKDNSSFGSLSKKDLKFNTFLGLLQTKQIKFPLYGKNFDNFTTLNAYLVSIEKKNTLPVLIRIKYLTFRNSKTLKLYSIGHLSITSRIYLLNKHTRILFLILKRFNV